MQSIAFLPSMWFNILSLQKILPVLNLTIVFPCEWIIVFRQAFLCFTAIHDDISFIQTGVSGMKSNNIFPRN